VFTDAYITADAGHVTLFSLLYLCCTTRSIIRSCCSACNTRHDWIIWSDASRLLTQLTV